MAQTTQIKEKWIKASILGTIWASSEIVLGSFLHNLRVPFSGNILTSIALVILISASYRWKDAGLFWRAGLICALLKTMSPSAVIFGPMIAIFMESVLLEISVRLFGRTIAGYVFGSALAMSWNLFHKIGNYIIFYGYNIVEVYTNLMKYAEKQLYLKFDAVWAPVVLLFAIYALFGAFSAIVGIRTGKKLLNQNTILDSSYKKFDAGFSMQTKHNGLHYSVTWLLVNLFMMVVPLVLINRIGFGPWALTIITVAAIWAFRYKRALKQIARPRLWVFFVVITMITAFVFTRLQTEPATITQALQIGIEMNLRAIVLIMGFTVLGTELYNPKIREYFANGYFKQLPLALELAAESLPSVIANTPDLKTILRNPGNVVGNFIGFAEFRLNEIRKTQNFKQNIFLITGEIGSGKTSLIKNIVNKLKTEKYEVSGFYSLRILKEGKTIGYDLVDISTGGQKKFLSLSGNENQQKIGNYYICENGLNEGNKLLVQNHSDLIVVDEIGKLELGGKGWAHSFRHLTTSASNSHLLISVRQEVVNEVIKFFGIEPEIIYNTSENNSDFLYNFIKERLDKN